MECSLPTLFRLVARFARVMTEDSSRNSFASTVYFAQSQTTLFPCIPTFHGEMFRGGNNRGATFRGEYSSHRSVWPVSYLWVRYCRDFCLVSVFQLVLRSGPLFLGALVISTRWGLHLVMGGLHRSVVSDCAWGGGCPPDPVLNTVPSIFRP